MRRVDEFKISQRPYSVDPRSLESAQGTPPARVGAVWYRRKNGLLSAHIGYLWDYQRPATQTVEEFLARHDDGRYGGTCLSRWNGHDLWTCCGWETAQQHKELLEAMLAGYPAAPEGYDGWWVFDPPEAR